jgi:dephospho-CoA kinase
MRIAFTGSHSTGKTTLSEHFPNRIDEIARTIIKEVGSPDKMEQEQ